MIICRIPPSFFTNFEDPKKSKNWTSKGKKYVSLRGNDFKRKYTEIIITGLPRRDETLSFNDDENLSKNTFAFLIPNPLVIKNLPQSPNPSR